MNADEYQKLAMRTAATPDLFNNNVDGSMDFYDALKCIQCGQRMRGVEVFDTGSDGAPDIAWNLYACQGCGMVARENVWSHKGIVWVAATQDPTK